MTHFKQRGLGGLFTAAALSGLLVVTSVNTPAHAQSFEAVIRVNDQAITQYEIDQRARMLQLFRAPGDPVRLARKQLIEDRLKLDAAKANGITLEEPDIQAGMEEFADRTGMGAEEFLRALDGAGIYESTFRDFVRAGLSWRELTQTKFGPRVSVSPDDISRAKKAVSETDGVRVLISEIIMVAPPPQAQAVMARAQQIAQTRSPEEFSAAARRYSAAGTRAQGGRLQWMPITELPPALRPIILNLAPGQVTDPLPIEGAVALFQLRDIEEIDGGVPETAVIDYAIYYINGGLSDAALKTAAEIRARVDTCDDLYGVAQGQSPDVLVRESQAPNDIPQDLRFELAKLDDGEISNSLTTSGGQTLMLVMMCGRTPVLPEGGPSDEDLTNFIRNKRLDSFANGYLEQLKSEARIVER